jgi:eukaryotic-like serine/threonine-protein kinase
MAKSRIGPFALEAPMTASKGSVQVFRALHLEQKKLAALRVFPVPLGMTPESRAAFASQLEQLKQLRHPSIARCYGGGFDTRNAYLASELVDGDSLDKILARRDRLSWETVLEYSQQLAEALQYAHQMGWVHGRLRPEKIVISSEGRAKICDFRREAITALMGDGPPTVQQLLYTAPEIFENQAADEKSDLYSIGALMYVMLTGEPPIAATTTEELLRRISTEVPASASSKILDCPVWLNAIVDKLLSKDPKQRPFSTTALQLAFKEAQRRHVEGVGVLQHATAGFSALQMGANREEAEKVLGIKPQKKRRDSDGASFFERPWVLLTGLAFAVAVVVWFLLPLNEETLRKRAEIGLASTDWIKWNEARDTYLYSMVERFPEGKHTEWAKEQIDWVDMQEAERQIERRQRMGITPKSEPERRYIEAKSFEDFGDRVTALEKYRGIVKILSDDEDDRPIINLARRQLRAIEASPPDANQLQKLLTAKLETASGLYNKSDVVSARQIWESIVNLYEGNRDLAPLVAKAQERLTNLKSSPTTNSPR